MAKVKAVSSEAKTQETKSKNRYELMFILPAGLGEKAKEKSLKTVKDTIQASGAEIFFEDTTWGERLMAYPIKAHTHGLYVVYGFETFGSNIKDINDNLQLEQEVLRFLVINVPAAYEFTPYTSLKEKYAVAPVVKKTSVAPKPKPSVKKSEDKKLDDILSDEI